MVLEQFLDNPHVKRHAFFIFFLSIVYVFIAYGIAYLFFREHTSLVAIFTLTILLIPSLNHITSLEEKIERKSGLKHFLRNHLPIFKIYASAFVGIIFSLVVIGSVFGTDIIYSYQTSFLTEQHAIGEEAVSRFAGQAYAPKAIDALGLFSENLEVLLIAFALSVFYGAGAVFLVVFNASLFSAFLFYFMNAASKGVAAVNFIHFIPEIFGFLLAGMAGAILSVAILRESFSSPYLKNVLKNTCLLVTVAIVLILVAAVLEVFVTGAIIHSLISF